MADHIEYDLTAVEGKENGKIYQKYGIWLTFPGTNKPLLLSATTREDLAALINLFIADLQAAKAEILADKFKDKS